MVKRLIAAAVLALLGIAAQAQTETPERFEEVLWSLMSYNGRDYSPTFCREDGDMVCVIADAASFTSIRTSLVYWWPTTGEWYTDSKALNVVHEGRLELRDRRGRLVDLEPVTYTYCSVHERYSQVWRVLLGREAEEEWARYQGLQEAYRTARSGYGIAKASWDEEYADLSARIASLRETGRPYRAELDRLEGMRPPTEPAEASEYLIPPAEPRTGYVLRLPPGTYAARLVTPEGLVLEGSERTVVAFPREGAGTVGYDLIPSDRWTKTVESNQPSSVIYSAGGVHLYARPFFQDEYNDLFYKKAIDNDANGNPALRNWIKVRQVEAARIEVTGGHGATLRVEEMPYYVEQTEGTAMGYAIVAFDAEGAHRGQDPTLRAFDLPVPTDADTLRLRLFDAEGRSLPGGDREIRVVKVAKRPYATLLLVLIPFFMGIAVLAVRGRKTGI